MTGDTLQGRRVESLAELELPGDYYLNPVGDGGPAPSLWFFLPRIEPCPEQHRDLPYGFLRSWDHFWKGTHRINGTWSITSDGAGPVTVSPSILTWTELGEARIRTEWHGYLEGGIWREV